MVVGGLCVTLESGGKWMLGQRGAGVWNRENRDGKPIFPCGRAGNENLSPVDNCQSIGLESGTRVGNGEGAVDFIPTGSIDPQA